ncbi:hypothetical protein L227DRAFT_611743 [Lentinus tigrinus ALCF2SS1-6]|uniref:Uncharacterized protein n=1 Tax=Lentinus tigrinus ALCF2SS1-6 TaxID=1328759 RepID=A0A5C2S892_9APHY|nr:hypothetical protein L227DRAFT_611743 [Lentinus tigrinus ALCF2SS1-6]
MLQNAMQFCGIRSIFQASSGNSRQTRRVSTSRRAQDAAQVGIWDLLRWVLSGPVVSYLGGSAIVFAFTTPAQYCFRAMASLIKYMTGMLPTPVMGDPIIPEAPVTASPASTQSNLVVKPEARNSREASTSTPSRMTNPQSDAISSSSPEVPAKASSLPVVSGGGSTSLGVDPLAPTVQHRKSKPTASCSAHPRHSTGSSDVGVPRWHPHDKEPKEETKPAHKHAGEPSFYHNGLDMMIRERICTHRIIPPTPELESDSELHAFRLPPELIGKISELAVPRYICWMNMSIRCQAALCRGRTERRLALFAVQAVFTDEHALSRQNLCSLFVDFLTI